MKIEVLGEAKQDLISGYHFYEQQSPGLGSYFLDTLFSDIDSLVLYAGTHRLIYGAHRCLSRRFPLRYTIALQMKRSEWWPYLIVAALQSAQNDG